MFSGFMVDTWIVATIVAVVAGAVGLFTVLRGSSFAAHAMPQTGFAGAAGASLLGVSTILGLGVFALLSALGIAALGRRGRHDAVTALALVMMLGLGALFLSFSVEYAPEIYSLLFGEVLGISQNELLPTLLLGIACLIAVGILYRPLMVNSILGDIGEARGIRGFHMELCFLLLVALTTTMSVPVVGTMLMFSLMIGPPAAARALVRDPARAISLSIAISLLTVWSAIALSYVTNWPVGFFVGSLSALFYVLGRLLSAGERRRVAGLFVTS